ncbi:hypothetical protein ACN38_g7192 [Penicillium nordicum]|uniref:Uncharacterized protein n=1 Tax=Penicillium nordicum TaxID=229535 RepID=A0A0M8P225_9EURO|nr:hypothetical protein ACN38_g7192 [Penicillium nordicum]
MLFNITYLGTQQSGYGIVSTRYFGDCQVLSCSGGSSGLGRALLLLPPPLLLIPSFSFFSISSNFAAACLTHKIHHALLYSLRWQRRAVCQRQHHPLRPS